MLGLPNVRDERLAIGRPDNNSINLLLNQVVHLTDLTSHIANGIEHDDSDIFLFFGGGFKGTLIGCLATIDTYIILGDTDSVGAFGTGEGGGNHKRM